MSKEVPQKRMGRPVRQSGEANTKDRILDAAIFLFSERGYERTTIKQIAQAVDLTESAFYRHYKGKEEVLDEILAYTERSVSQPLPKPGKNAQLGGPSIFRLLFETPVDAFAENPYALRVSRIIYMESAHNEKMRRYLKYAMEEKADAEVGRILADQVEGGSIVPCDIESVAHIVNVIRYQWCYQVAVLDWGTAYDAEGLKGGLEATIVFFERLYSRWGEMDGPQGGVSKPVSQGKGSAWAGPRRGAKDGSRHL